LGHANGGASEESRLNVLLITLDTTRADRIGCYGYAPAGTPNIDALAARGSRFASAYSPVPLTLPAHCSVLMGKYPTAHRVRNNGSYHLTPGHVTLAEVLRERGLPPPPLSLLSPLTRGSGSTRASMFTMTLSTAGRRSRVSGRSVRPIERPPPSSTGSGEWGQEVFRLVHFFDPHLPYAPPPPFDQQFKAHPYDGESPSWTGKSADGASPRRGGFLEQTLVILAGDHGEALGEKKEIDHGFFLYEPTLRCH